MSTCRLSRCRFRPPSPRRLTGKADNSIYPVEAARVADPVIGLEAQPQIIAGQGGNTPERRRCIFQLATLSSPGITEATILLLFCAEASHTWRARGEKDLDWRLPRKLYRLRYITVN